MFQKNNILCVVCSAGGHLAEASLALEQVDYPKYFVTYKLPHIEESLRGIEFYYVTNPHKNFFKYITNFGESLQLYIKKRPRFILSTGSGMALSTCLVGKIFGSKIIYIETGARIYTPSLTGRLMYFISDLFIVQWKPLLAAFPKATYGGLLF